VEVGYNWLRLLLSVARGVQVAARLVVWFVPAARHAQMSTRVVTIATGPHSALTSWAIKARFGKPLAEDFIADTGIGLTAKFGTDGKADEITIAAFQSLLDYTIRPRNLPALNVDRILDELVPLAERTGRVGGMAEGLGIAFSRSEQFDNVTIWRVTVSGNGAERNRALGSTSRPTLNVPVQPLLYNGGL
jgi:hypothetical protein